VRLRLRALFIFLALGWGLCVLFPSIQLSAQRQSSKPEEIEWTWEVRPAHADPKLPNVLLAGDSITRNYFPEVKRRLDKVANVYLFATSASVGDPRLTQQLAQFSSMEAVPFKVVHFNNGMHGWDYSEEEYRTAFPSFLRALRAISPKATFIWTTITPVKVESVPGPTNARIEARNSIAQSFVTKPGIQVDDQHALMTNHKDLYEDNVHFGAVGAAIQGEQAAKSIRAALGGS
jgi:hypothetical protein